MTHLAGFSIDAFQHAVCEDMVGAISHVQWHAAYDPDGRNDRNPRPWEPDQADGADGAGAGAADLAASGFASSATADRMLIDRSG